MNFRKLGIVIEREYLNKVKKKSFLLITFLTPVLFAGIAILPSLIMLGAKEEAKQVGVVDRSGIVMPYLESGEVLEYKDLGADADVEAIKADLNAADIDILLSISPLDPQTKSVTADTYSLKPLGMDSGSAIENRINDAVEAYRIDSYGIENLEEIMHSVKSNVHVYNYTISESGEESISESGVYMAISMILGMALYMFIALFSGMVMSSVIEEKSSRVVEVLVSSVKATELMFGKIIGVALVALTQFLLWILLTLLLLAVAGGIIGKDKIMGMMTDDPTTEMVAGMNENVNLHPGPGRLGYHGGGGRTYWYAGDHEHPGQPEPGSDSAVVHFLLHLWVSAVCVAVCGHWQRRGERGRFHAVAAAGDGAADVGLFHRPVCLQGAGQHAGVLGLHDSVHFAHRDAGAHSFWRAGLGIGPVHGAAGGYVCPLRVGIGQNLQGGHPHVWQEIFL